MARTEDRLTTARGKLLRLYGFVFRMLGDAGESVRVLEGAWDEAAPWIASGDPELGRDAFVPLVEILAGLQQAPCLSFDHLDELLRSEPTQPVGPENRDRRRLVWDLQQTCLTATLCCLGSSERLAFGLVSVAGLTAVDARKVLGITDLAFRVRLSRATTKLEHYLGPRCSLVLRDNPCRCSSRATVLARTGFLQEGLADPELSERVALPRGDVVALYRALPPPRLPLELERRLASTLEAG